MDTLHMIQCTLDLKAFMAFAQEQGLDPGRDELDLGYLGHAWLKAAFGKLAPRPWRLLKPRRQDRCRPCRILAYSDQPAEVLADHLARYAEPSVTAVCPPEAVLGKALPREWLTGRSYAFEVLCCPVGRKAGSGREKDIFLIAADHSDDGALKREDVYRRWFKSQVEAVEGIEVKNVVVQGFRLSKVLRKTQGHPRKAQRRIRPQALFKGVLQARDGASLLGLLQRGIGRHRAFGFGMVLLSPV